jgi:hypothetical protein
VFKKKPNAELIKIANEAMGRFLVDDTHPNIIYSGIISLINIIYSDIFIIEGIELNDIK